MLLPFKFEWDVSIGHYSLLDDTEDGTESELLLEGAVGIEEQVVHASMHALRHGT